VNLTKPVWVIISKSQNQEDRNKQLYFAYNPYFNAITNMCIVTHVVYSKYNTKVKRVASKCKNIFSCEVFML